MHKKPVIIFSAALAIVLVFLLTKPKTIEINGTKLYVEVAYTAQKQQQGLMNRKSLAQNAGMLFVFPKEDLYLPLFRSILKK